MKNDQNRSIFSVLSVFKQKKTVSASVYAFDFCKINTYRPTDYFGEKLKKTDRGHFIFRSTTLLISCAPPTVLRQGLQLLVGVAIRGYPQGLQSWVANRGCDLGLQVEAANRGYNNGLQLGVTIRDCN